MGDGMNAGHPISSWRSSRSPGFFSSLRVGPASNPMISSVASFIAKNLEIQNVLDVLGDVAASVHRQPMTDWNHRRESSSNNNKKNQT